MCHSCAQMLSLSDIVWLPPALYLTRHNMAPSSTALYYEVEEPTCYGTERRYDGGTHCNRCPDNPASGVSLAWAHPSGWQWFMVAARVTCLSGMFVCWHCSLSLRSGPLERRRRCNAGTGVRGRPLFFP